MAKYLVSTSITMKHLVVLRRNITSFLTSPFEMCASQTEKDIFDRSSTSFPLLSPSFQPALLCADNTHSRTAKYLRYISRKLQQLLTMPRVGGSGSFSGRPGGNIYAPVRTPQQTRLSQAERDIGLPNSYPRAPTRNPQPQRFAQPPPGRSDHRQSMKFTPWVLNLESETHKCADLNLFREPKPQPPASMAIFKSEAEDRELSLNRGD